MPLLPPVVKENHTGRQGSARTAQRTYYISGATDEPSALVALLNDPECPTVVGVLPRTNSLCTVEELEAGRYLGTAIYQSPDWVRPADTFTVSFDISGQTLRVTQSKQTMGKYAPSGVTPKDFRGAINVQQDGTVDGVDLIFPFLCYSVTYTFNDSEITTAFVNTLALIVGSVNNAAFHGYAVGELLLTKVSGQKRTDGSLLWDVNFGFAVSRNKNSDFYVNPGAPTAEQIKITAPVTPAGPAKRGWDYLWVRYEERSVGSGATATYHKVPVAAYVEQVYDYTDFSLLAIGV